MVNFVTANIVPSCTDYIKNNPDVINKLLAAHVNETRMDKQPQG